MLFALTLIVKQYGKKEYPFLFASNIATAENNTPPRRVFSSDRSHNTRSSQSRFYVVNYIVHLTHSFLAGSFFFFFFFFLTWKSLKFLLAKKKKFSNTELQYRILRYITIHYCFTVLCFKHYICGITYAKRK